MLALGIRPSVAAACGVEPPGTVDILDAQGITGWQIGMRLLLHEAQRSGPEAAALVCWARAEVRADAERWNYLASFVDTLRGAVDDHAADRAADAQDTYRFWRGWQRNIAHAQGLLTTTGLVVSPETLETLDQLHQDLQPTDGGPTPKCLARLLDTATVHADRSAGSPPPLVLPDHRDTLVDLLGHGATV